MIVPSEKSVRILAELQAFMTAHVYPNETAHREALGSAENRFASMPLVESLKEKARSAGLWNLFVPPDYAEYSDHGGMSFLDYAPLAEEMGRVIWSPEVFNCNAPDTGNMEVLMKFGYGGAKSRLAPASLGGRDSILLCDDRTPGGVE